MAVRTGHVMKPLLASDGFMLSYDIPASLGRGLASDCLKKEGRCMGWLQLAMMPIRASV